jgi:RimJ/RimL family protein N-acetyltransferase
MATVSDTLPQLTIRPIQYRDLENLEQLWAIPKWPDLQPALHPEEDWKVTQQWMYHWYWPLKALSWFPNPWQHLACFYVAEQEKQPLGVIQVLPFNQSRSTWRVQRVMTAGTVTPEGGLALAEDVGSVLLRYCLEKIWEARTWVADVNVNDKATLALYRKNGFQPLAQITRWSIGPDCLKMLAEQDSTGSNLLPVSNADAQLLYQLDTVSMPPLLRQVFDRHIQDFQINLLEGAVRQGQQLLNPRQAICKYAFEPQRKAAIGHFQLQLCKDGSYPHKAKLTVHPAYTWLYPELVTHMARLTQTCPPQTLFLKSADYQPEREAYLESIAADRVEHSLLMSRSVWHKLREQRGVSLEGLQLSEMLQGLQPSRKPIPSRMIHHWKDGDWRREGSTQHLCEGE